ncbi:MAG: hypothetical protein M2R45_03463 [Verrucomicrobia subdivision 3 bacterium]|nr:hypothetical protein [Limisphaerales bacterium]
MSSAINILKGRFSKCVCSSCETSNCKLKLSDFPSEKIILDIDCVEQQELAHIQGKRCDYIIVIEQGGFTFLVPAEFKSESVRESDVKEQLEGGIRFFAEFYNDQFTCYPVLVSKRLSRPASHKLKRILINYNSKKVRIKRVKCNDSLLWNKVKSQV